MIEGARLSGSIMKITEIQIATMITAGLLWFIFFVLAPARAVKVGLALDDPPVFFRRRIFRVIQVAALAAMLGVAYLEPLDSLARVTFGEVMSGLGNVYLGSLIAFVATLVFFFGIPEIVAGQRIRREEHPGEMRSPTLTLCRWIWVGVALVLCLGVPFFEDLVGFPIALGTGVAIGVAGPLLYALWWGLPSGQLARMAEADDPHAIHALPKVRRYGLPAWLAFKMQRGFHRKVKMEARTHKLCPSCMRPIDQVEMYDSLKFDACPHCNEMIPPVYALEDYIRHYADLFKSMSDSGGKRKGRLGRHESDAVQRILRATLTLALRERATDLHFIAEGENFIVRARTDGMLYTMVELNDALMRSMISALKVQSNLDITERRKPQDGSFKISIGEKHVDIRINTSPSSGGETASLRLLYRHEVLGSLDKIGMNSRIHRICIDYIQRSHGLILVTGPTGSGKSTTLYNALATIADGKRNIITLEDPIEYKIEGLTQMQIEPSKNFTFVSGLRSILRQDPDVIMVGEIRDAETARMTIDAAMTGHLVFSTLHTIDTSTCVGRLSDLGVDPHRHAEALLMIIAQRLVRLNCELCQEEIEVSAAELAGLGLPGAPERLMLKKGRGCPRCHETGYFEREGIYEVMMPNDRIREMISMKSSSTELMRVARRQGMRTLLEDGLTKVVLGKTTVEEVMRVTA